MGEALDLLLADASVLIDFRDSDIDLLGLLSGVEVQINVLRPVLEQVRGVSASACRHLRIGVVDVDARDLLAAVDFAPDLGSKIRSA